MKASRLAVVLGAALLMTACNAPVIRDAATPDAANDVVQPGGHVASSPEVDSTAAEDPLVCEPVIRTGTRVAKRRCMRRSALERQQQGGQNALGEWQRRGVQVGNETRP